MSLRNGTRGCIGFTISEFAQEMPRDLMNGLRENYSRWRRDARRDEVLVDLDLSCVADPGIGLGWEAGIRTPIPWSRERFTRFGLLRCASFAAVVLADAPVGSLQSRSALVQFVSSCLSCGQRSRHSKRVAEPFHLKVWLASSRSHATKERIQGKPSASLRAGAPPGVVSAHPSPSHTGATTAIRRDEPRTTGALRLRRRVDKYLIHTIV
jgi:hypothetical protein